MFSQTSNHKDSWEGGVSRGESDIDHDPRGTRLRGEVLSLGITSVQVLQARVGQLAVLLRLVRCTSSLVANEHAETLYIHSCWHMVGVILTS